jgi:hypothetical protein
MWSGGKTFCAFVGDVGPEVSQRIHQRLDRALLHTFGTGDGVLALRDGEVCGHESHRRPRCLDVDHVGHIMQRGNHYFCVVTIGKIVGNDFPAGYGMYDQRTVAHTFRCG